MLADYTIRHNHADYLLRPSLAAAVRLHRKYGMTNVLKGIAEQRTYMIAAVIDELLQGIYPPEDIRALKRQVVTPFLTAHHAELFTALAFELVGIENPDALKDDPSTEGQGSKVDFDKLYRELFKIGTGKLGWEPNVVWYATPVELMVANEGRNDLLKAIFGSGEAEKPKPKAQSTELFEAHALSYFRAKGLKVAS